MRRQHDIGMRGGDGGIENRAQERASVGHIAFKAFEAETGNALIHPIAAKENPRGMPRGFLLDSLKAVSRRRRR
jgi:hypothetical protein